MLKALIKFTNKLDKDIDEIVRKFLFFIEEWAEGLLDGHYPLTKTDILKKFTELLLEPFMVKFNYVIAIQDEQEDEKYDLWNKIVEDKNLIVINGSDEIVDEFMQKFICTIVPKYEELARNCKTIKKVLMRNLESSRISSFSEFYEYLWKTEEMPLVIHACSEKNLQEINRILKMSRETIPIILLNKSDFAAHNLRSSRMISTVSDLSREQQKQLLTFPVKLQGRDLNGIQKLNIDEDRILSLNVRDIIYILCNKVNIGEDLETFTDICVDVSLKRVWLKPVVLQEVTNDVFAICCNLNCNFKEFVQRQNLNINESVIIEFKDIRTFNLNSVRIILYENKDDLKISEDVLKNINGKPIHFLIFHKNFKLEWVKSWGTIGNLQNFRKSEKSEEKEVMNKEEIMNFCTEMKLIIMSSNSEIGKSVFSSFFVRNVPTHFWVLKVNMVKYTAVFKNFFNESKRDTDLKGLFDQILEEECKGDSFLVKPVFEKFFQSKKIMIFLEDFSEISTKHQNDAKQFIKFLNTLGYFLLITTTPDFKNELELLLNTFSLSLTSAVVKMVIEA